MSEAPRSSRKMPAAPRVAPRAPQRDWLAPEEQSDPFSSTTHGRRRSDAYAYSDDHDSYDEYADYTGDDYAAASVPLLTLPTIPALPVANAAPPTASPEYDDEYDDEYDEYDEYSAPPAGRASASSRRSAVRPRQPTPRGWRDNSYEDENAASEWDGDAEGDAWREQPTRRAARVRQQSAARPLALVRARMPNPSTLLARIPSRPQAHEREPHLIPGLRPEASVPALATHSHMRLPARPRVNTRAIIERARSPWSMTRTLLAVLAITFALWMSVSHAGEPSQPLMAIFQTHVSSYDTRAIASLVEPQTQGTRPDLYDSKAQFDDWWNAACSAAVMSEVLTAWGEKNMSIGKMIDAMQPDISLNGGLLTPHGFQRGAAAFGYRADINWHLSYQQMLYITNKLGLPVIVNVRISYGYYRFFSGGHFLVMTGGDSQGVKIVDSSEYYIHYLPIDTFNSMFTGMTAVIVPKDYQYDVPSI